MNDLQLIEIDQDPDFVAAAAFLRQRGLPTVSEFAAGLEHRPCSVSTFDAGAENPLGYFAADYFGPVSFYGRDKDTGIALGQRPDRLYIETYVAPFYAQAKIDQRPTGHFIRARLLDHFIQYRRLILPVTKDKSRRKLMVLSWIDCFVQVRDPTLPLSSDEAACLLLLSDGATTKDIAGRLHIGLDGVRVHIESARRKLGAKNPTHAISIAMLKGIFGGPRLPWAGLRHRTEVTHIASDIVASPDQSMEIACRGGGKKLSPSETKLVSALAQGISLRRHAEAVGISYNTARWHLARIFGKTGQSRQADLICWALQTEFENFRKQS